jgi:hypothetical protein
MKLLLPFITVAKTIGPFISTSVRGVNTADRLAAVLASTGILKPFKWNPVAQLDIQKKLFLLMFGMVAAEKKARDVL